MATNKKDFFIRNDKKDLINWKSVVLLRRYTTRFGDIKPRKYSGNSVSTQKSIRKAIIRARELGLIHYIK